MNQKRMRVNTVIRVLEILGLRFQNKVAIIKFRAHLPYLKKFKHDVIVNCVLHGELTYDFVNYYELNDCILAEGYLSLSTIDLMGKPYYDLDITRLYPFLFTFDEL